MLFRSYGMQESIEISCSVGVAIYGKKREDYTALFSKADMAMYRAKKEGKNQYSVAEYENPTWKIQKEASIENRRSQYNAGDEKDMDFLTKAFLLLSHAKDVNNSLNMLLERIGREYDLGIVTVLEENQQENEVYRGNAWCRKRGILPRHKFSSESWQWEEYLKTLNNKEVVCINECFLDSSIGEKSKRLFREKGIRAMVNCSFSYFDRGKGYVMFGDTEKVRTWSAFERDTFQELTRLLSVFVAVRKQQEEEQKIILQLKKRDTLTGLYNEQAFMEKAKKIIKNWKEGMQYAVVYTDINDFSYVNDNYGHDAGNEILKSVADQIDTQGECVSCRLYSDLFIGILWDKDKDSILQRVVTKNLNFCNQQKKKYATENIKLSTGIYFMESPGEKLEIAIENANMARKSIKKSGNIFCRVYEKKLRQQREDEKRIIETFQETLEDRKSVV